MAGAAAGWVKAEYRFRRAILFDGELPSPCPLHLGFGLGFGFGFGLGVGQSWVRVWVRLDPHPNPHPNPSPNPRRAAPPLRRRVSPLHLPYISPVSPLPGELPHRSGAVHSLPAAGVKRVVVGINVFDPTLTLNLTLTLTLPA